MDLTIFTILGIILAVLNLLGVTAINWVVVIIIILLPWIVDAVASLINKARR